MVVLKGIDSSPLNLNRNILFTLKIKNLKINRAQYNPNGDENHPDFQ